VRGYPAQQTRLRVLLGVDDPAIEATTQSRARDTTSQVDLQRVLMRHYVMLYHRQFVKKKGAAQPPRPVHKSGLSPF
jgi:hypothetical protein